MFKIDTNVGGESGPFLNYKNRAGQGMPDGSWYLREKQGDDSRYTDMTATMRGGIVADIFATPEGQLGGTLKIGYVKFNDNSAPDRHWWRTPLASEPRPNEAKNSEGSYDWQNAVAFRAAIGGGKSALFDVSGWSGYKGVMEMINLMNGGFASNIGKCPMVQYTGFRVEGTGKTRLHVPEFVIAKWVDRPACLMPEAPQVSVGFAAAPQPAPQPAPAAVPEDIAF
jgi:hypothetical protein